MRTHPFVAAVALLTFCLPSATAKSGSKSTGQSSAGPSAPEQVAVDTQRLTPGGAQFTVPAGWSIASGTNLVLLTPPETDTHIAIFDTQAPDAKTAVAAAWAAYSPDAKRPIKLIAPRPAREGWDEGEGFNYETSPSERAVVFAFALRSGNSWTVLILDGSLPTVVTRGAQINLVYESVRPKNYARESFAGLKAHPLDAARIEQLKTFVQTSMQQLGIPGASLALIDHGKVVYEGGFGVKELGKPDPVDQNTLFMAASNTTGQTTLLLSELVDEKKLRWDQPVIEVYPKFKLGSEDTTKQVLVNHLICACTGMPQQDLEWLFNFKSYTPDTVFTLLGRMQPTSQFGEVFQYSNLMAAAAGYIGAHIVHPDMDLGAAYDKAMQEKIFDPLGMNSTTFDFARALAGNHASPHGDDVDGKPAVASMAFDYSIYSARPAGGEWTSAHDLARYVQNELSLGKLPNGTQMVSQENLLMRRKPLIMNGEDTWYGMGLEVNHKYGVPLVSHGGSLAGFKSNFYFLPDSGIGLVILTNADTGGMLVYAIGRRLLEVAFDGKPEAAANVASDAVNYKANLAKERKRLVVPADSAIFERLAPRYSNAQLGQISVLNSGGATTFDFGVWKSAMASRKNDDGTVSLITIDPANSGAEFVVGELAGKRILTLRDAQHNYTFNETE